ncbi:MAG: hypothetical protein GWM98_12560, partial [Nitrospinaceae bacterium]|nr:hypothetical protein [Nitrospinaceae bacterium]NIR55160.1 hypothetical protein [Nitrospinaceae bacterium]NIS85584.1 hypothetical protein [Nitrospinaceae bacterium]NIT82430.1 hypothetical protein [Nitrospinaceae bacterium]NIU44641.1 hypothetical protein [Nitrospinaceae bacterium]
MIQVRASQIFTNDRDQAVAAKKQLDAGSPFTEIVEKYSTCPSKQNGGDLGWMPEANASALMGTVTEKDEGRILGPIHSPYGYHILKITEIKVEEAESVFHADTPMVDIIKVLPEIHTLLFQKFHIGMPVSGYAPEETLFTLCEKHSKNIGEVLAAVNAEAAQKAHPTMAPE